MDFLNKFTVRTRIIGLFLLFIGIFIIFGIFTIKKVGLMAEVSQTLFDHPMQVSNAALEANNGILRMHRSMKDVSMSKSELEANLAIYAVHKEEQVVYQKLNIVQKFILGQEGKDLVKMTITMFSDWRPIREEVVELVIRGDRDAANEITQGKGADHVARLERKMQELTSYAHAKATGCMVDVSTTHNEVDNVLLWGIIAVSFICLAAAFIVINSIVVSLTSLKNKMNSITSTGDLSMVSMAGENEITELATRFNILIATLQDQLWLRDNLNELNRQLGGNLSLQEMTDTSINFVARSINSCGAAFYICQGKGMVCNLASFFALAKGVHFAESFSRGVGIVGQVAAEKKPIFLENISSEDACSKAATISKPPKNIYTVPVLFQGELLAIIEIGSFETITPLRKQFIDDASLIIANRLNIAIQQNQINDLLEKSLADNKALQHKSKELDASNTEISAVNVELKSQAQELQAQKNELEAQATELESKRLQVEEADRLKSEFLSNMSHELRTPLNSIMSLSQLLIRRGVTNNPEKSTKYIQVIERNGRQLLNLINDILDLSKIEAGRMDIYPISFETGLTIERLLSTMKPIAEEKKLIIVKDIENAPRMFSDEEKIYQILMNFLSNAIKFTDSGSIELTVQEVDETISFAVSDSGIGISPTGLTGIFDEFRQVDGSFTREHEGTGLGLSIAQKLAVMLGGTITVDSTIGVGSTFTLILPKEFIGNSKQDVSVIRNREELAPCMPETSTDKRLILVVEDNEIASMQICDTLKEHGFDVVSAKNGIEGLAYVEKSLPDGIILDLMMPKVDGFQVLEQIRSKPETATLPVLILTAKELTAADRSNLSNNNIQQLIQKGNTDREQLISCVKSMLISDIDKG